MSAKANEQRTFSIAESTELVRAMLRQEKVHDMNVLRFDFAEPHPILSNDIQFVISYNTLLGASAQKIEYSGHALSL